MSDIETNTINETAQTAESPNSTVGNGTYSIEYVLSQLEKLQNDSIAFTNRLFEMIAKNKSGGPGDIGAQGNGQALQAMAAEHGATNRRLIDFYQKMYDDILKSQ